MHGFKLDGLDDEDVDHIVSSVDTLNVITKATSDIADQGEGLEQDSDLPACPDNSEPDTTLDQAEILTSKKAIRPTCYSKAGQKRKSLPAESTATMVTTHEYVIDQDFATLEQLHQAGYLLQVKTISADFSSNLDATIALHWAARSGCLRALKYLLDRGVNPSAIDNEEHSQKRAALHYATISGCSEGVDVLIERGADVQALDAESWSPLHHAATLGSRTISKALLKAGASVDLRNSSMKTPLHCAAREGYIDVIMLLLDWGADISAEDLEVKLTLGIW